MSPKMMTPKEFSDLTWTNASHVNGTVRGVVLSLHGLNMTALKEGPNEEDLALAQKGFLTIFPYYGPWSWMNREARRLVDEVVAFAYKKHKLASSTPLIVAGGSMGGFSALLFARYTRHKLARCLAVCPVCDLKAHFGERPDLPRTIRNAFYGYRESLEDLFREHSPAMQVAGMPDIPYMIVHTTGDRRVNKGLHSDKLVARMKRRGMEVTYLEVRSKNHCAPLPARVEAAKLKFMTGA